MDKSKYLLTVMAALVLAACSSKKDQPVVEKKPSFFDMEHKNPFVTSIYAADPSAHVWADGRLYVYPSHDIDPPRGCDLMDQYHVFSTADMVNWKDEGQILEASQVPWGTPDGNFMWAPDCAYRNGTYYFYFPHPSGSPWNSTWKIGVATSTKPARVVSLNSISVTNN